MYLFYFAVFRKRKKICLFWFWQECEKYKNKSLYCFVCNRWGSNDLNVFSEEEEEKRTFEHFKCNVKDTEHFYSLS